MNGWKNARRVALLAASLFVAGCSATGTMSKDVDERAKGMTPPEGKALVYVVRPAGVGMLVAMKVTCDGNYLGTTGGHRFLYAVLDSGAHVFASHAENKSELPIVLAAGKTYYLEQQVKMGLLMARNKLVRLDDVKGREKLLKCALSKDLAATPPVPATAPSDATAPAPAAAPSDATAPAPAAAPSDTSAAADSSRTPPGNK
jgi:hypothetical protein